MNNKSSNQGEQEDAVLLMVARVDDEAELLYARTGHPGPRIMSRIVEQAKELNIGLDNVVPAHFCEPCVLAKSHRMPISRSNIKHARSSSKSKDKNIYLSHLKPLERIDLDTIGPYELQSLTGKKYSVTFTCKNSGMRWVEFARKKSDIPDLICNRLTNLLNQYEDKKIKKIRWDRGSEFRNKRVLNFLKKNGIEEDPTPPENPSLNGTAERTNGIVQQVARTILVAANLP